METVLQFIRNLIPEGFDVAAFTRTALIVCIGVLAVAAAGRLLFGKRSVLSSAVSSAISILFIYAVTIVVYSTGVNLSQLLSPLPFVTLAGEYLTLFVFKGTHYTLICGQLVSMIILAFLTNLANDWLPKGKKLLSWFFFRCLSVLLAMVLHLIVTAVLNRFLPQGLLLYAPAILLCLLVLMMAVGSMKFLVGILLTAVNPVIAVLYTFFFANVVGKALTKAVLTTAIIAGIVYLLNALGITAIFIGTSVLVAYIPLLILLLVLWWVAGRIF